MTKRNLPTGSLVVYTTKQGEPRYRAKWRDRTGKQCAPTIGPAWLDRRGEEWKPRKGRALEGHYTEKTALRRMNELIAEQDQLKPIAAATKAATFDQVAEEWLDHLVTVRRLKPSTVAGYRSLLISPGPSGKGDGKLKARIMRGFSGRKIADITTADIDHFLRALDREGLSGRNVNQHRQVLSSIFTYACRPETYALPANPVATTEKRRQQAPGPIDTLEPEEIQAVVRAAREGRHCPPVADSYGPEVQAERQRANDQDAALYLVASYTGLRQGELRALKWKNVDFNDGRITVEAAMSANELTRPKSGKIRTVPLADEAAAILDRLSKRELHTGRESFVFCGAEGQPLDGSAIRKRFKGALKAEGLRPRRFHDLRHTFASRIVRTLTLPEVQAIMGHSHISTTERYLHAQPRHDDAARISAAFAVDDPFPVPVGDQAEA